MTTSENLCVGSNQTINDNRVTATTSAVSPRGEIMMLIDAVAAQHGVTVADIIGQSRLRVIANARHDAIASVATMCPWLSYPHLGRIFGNRDHSTIMSSLRKRGALRAGGIVGSSATRRTKMLAISSLFDGLAQVLR